MDDIDQQLDHVEQRARRYWFEDGLAEISGGAVFVLVGAYFLAQRAIETRLAGAASHRAANIAVNLVFPALIVGLALAGRRLIKVAKDRFVHPRTGYVAFRRPSRGHRLATAALAFVISVLLALLFTRAPVLKDWMPALEGLVFGVAFLFLGQKAQMARFPLEGLACALVGLGVAMLRLDENLAAAALFGSLGAIFVVVGSIAFGSYLRQSPPPERP